MNRRPASRFLVGFLAFLLVASLAGTKVQSLARIAFHLGVKKEGKVFTRNMEVEKELTWAKLTPERVEETVNQILTEAIELRATDVHIEPFEESLRVRYRIDGVLRQIRSLHKTYWPAMAVRIKVMAMLNIAEKRLPQDLSASRNSRRTFSSPSATTSTLPSAMFRT
jgi:type II secretory ATPase GspE/PulE/Tfp pilus assembly ATPase PilB-like protein